MGIYLSREEIDRSQLFREGTNAWLDAKHCGIVETSIVILARNSNDPARQTGSRSRNAARSLPFGSGSVMIVGLEKPPKLGPLTVRRQVPWGVWKRTVCRPPLKLGGSAKIYNYPTPIHR